MYIVTLVRGFVIPMVLAISKVVCDLKLKVAHCSEGSLFRAVVAERLGPRTSIIFIYTGGPWFEPRPGSSALGQGALSSLPIKNSLSEETLSRRVGPVYRKRNTICT